MQITLRRSALAAVSAALAATMSVAGAVTPSFAQPTTAAQARVELDRLESEAGQIEEDWAQAKEALAAGNRRVEALNADIKTQQTKVAGLSGQAEQIALAQFQNRGVDTTTAIFVSGQPESFMHELSTVSKMSENMNSVIQDYQAQQANLTDLRRAADAEVEALKATEKKLADLDAKAKAKTAEMESILNRLTAQERAALAAQEAAALVRAPQAAAPAAATTQRQANQTSRNRVAAAAPAEQPVAPVSGNADPRALTAVAYAKSKIGSAYVWGAAGPSAFDCSGMTLAAYRAAGVSLPHSSRAQFGMGRSVSRGDLRPGDLLFWYSPVHHVGIYVGNGMFVHARNPRVGVVMQSLASYPAPYSGARRIVG